MLRNEEQRTARQEAMRHMQEQQATFDEGHRLLTLREAASLLNVSRGFARRLLRNEPGVHLIRRPGSSRTTVRVPRDVIERVLRRSANR